MRPSPLAMPVLPAIALALPARAYGSAWVRVSFPGMRPVPRLSRVEQRQADLG